MKLVTRQHRANAIHAEAVQYRKDGVPRSASAIFDPEAKTADLPANPSPDTIDQIYGTNWTHIPCSVCGGLVDKAVEFDFLDTGSAGCFAEIVCFDCLQDALVLLK